MRNEGFRIALLDARAALPGRIIGKVLSMHSSMLEGFRAELSCRRAGFNLFGQRLEIDTARPELGCELEKRNQFTGRKKTWTNGATRRLLLRF